MASRSSNRAAVPEAKGALDKFKYEVASELGVPLSDGYIGTVSEGITGISAGYKKGMSDKQALPFSLITKLEIGLEPTTPSLRVKCSTD